MRNLLKFLIGLLLLPVCFASGLALARILLLLFSGESTVLSPEIISFFCGIILWLAVYTLLPRPMLSYVLAHELTHMLWAWASGIKVTQFKVTRKGGHVEVAGSNFVMALAPYFFPLYTAILLLLYGLCSIFSDQSNNEMFWLAGIGLTWCFHLTFTFSMLCDRQPDIEEHGHLFSYTIILLLNVVSLLIGLVCVSRLNTQESFKITAETMAWTMDKIVELATAIYHLFT